MIERKPFTLDGCSGGLSRLWHALTGRPPPFENCCCVHDYLYWAGGTEQERRDADDALRRCVADMGYKKISWVIWAAVRLCGGSHFLYHGSHEWGWGIMDNVDKIVQKVGEARTVDGAIVDVETVAKTISDAVTSLDKKYAAIELLTATVKPACVPKFAFRLLVGVAIDAAVWLKNRALGHDWGKE